MRIRIFHNTNREAMLSGYTAGQSVVEVYAYEDTNAASTDDALEAAFERFNVGHDPQFGTPHPDALSYRKRLNRSLSVGDVLACDSNFYACASMGWQPIPAPRVVNLTQHGTTPAPATSICERPINEVTQPSDSHPMQ